MALDSPDVYNKEEQEQRPLAAGSGWHFPTDGAAAQERDGTEGDGTEPSTSQEPPMAEAPVARTETESEPASAEADVEEPALDAAPYEGPPPQAVEPAASEEDWERVFRSRQPGQVAIGIWGATSSGKTTYLVALKAAASKSGGRWKMSPERTLPDSMDFLITHYDEFVSEHKFPLATEQSAEYPSYGFNLSGTVEVEVRKFFKGVQIEDRDLTVQLIVRDHPGDVFLESERAASFLAHCDGILYLFDPTKTPADGWKNFISVMWRLDQLLDERAQVSRPRLAVCLTKYDDPEVYERLRLADPPLVIPKDYRGRRIPWVYDAKKAFELFAGEDVAEAIRDQSCQVEYFATSAVGFYASDDNPELSNFQSNALDTMDGPRLRAGAYPVNLIEPLLWLKTGELLDS